MAYLSRNGLNRPGFPGDSLIPIFSISLANNQPIDNSVEHPYVDHLV